MTKSELARQISFNLSQPTDENAVKYLNATLAEIARNLKAGHNIYLRGLGTFSLVKHKAKKVRNISTNESYTMPAHFRVKFIPSPVVKKAIIKLPIT